MDLVVLAAPLTTVLMVLIVADAGVALVKELMS